MEPFAQYGLAGLALGVVVVIARLFTSHVEKKDEHFVTFLSNHMSAHTSALRDVADALRALRDEVRRGS